MSAPCGTTTCCEGFLAALHQWTSSFAMLRVSAGVWVSAQNVHWLSFLTDILAGYEYSDNDKGWNVVVYSTKAGKRRKLSEDRLSFLSWPFARIRNQKLVSIPTCNWKPVIEASCPPAPLNYMCQTAVKQISMVFLLESNISGLCALRCHIQISMEAILACHPTRSTEWLAEREVQVNYDVCPTLCPSVVFLSHALCLTIQTCTLLEPVPPTSARISTSACARTAAANTMAALFVLALAFLWCEERKINM